MICLWVVRLFIGSSFDSNRFAHPMVDDGALDFFEVNDVFFILCIALPWLLYIIFHGCPRFRACLLGLFLDMISFDEDVLNLFFGASFSFELSASGMSFHGVDEESDQVCDDSLVCVIGHRDADDYVSVFISMSTICVKLLPISTILHRVLS